MSAPERPPGGYRLLCVSIRQDYYLVGNPSVHPVDIDALPQDVGTRFGSLAEIEGWVWRELRGISSYSQVRVIDDTETVVRLGFRAGRNGTGERWTWRQPSTRSPNIEPSEPTNTSPA